METSESCHDHFHLHRVGAHVNHKFRHCSAWCFDSGPNVFVFSASEGVRDEFSSSGSIIGFKHSVCCVGFSSSCSADYERSVQGVVFVDNRFWRFLDLDGVPVGMEQRDVSVPISCPSSLLAFVHPSVAAPVSPIRI